MQHFKNKFEVTLAPTLLLTPLQWNMLIDTSSIKLPDSPSIMVYLLVPDELALNIAKKLKSETGCPIVVLANPGVIRSMRFSSPPSSAAPNPTAISKLSEKHKSYGLRSFSPSKTARPHTTPWREGIGWSEGQAECAADDVSCGTVAGVQNLGHRKNRQGKILMRQPCPPSLTFLFM